MGFRSILGLGGILGLLPDTKAPTDIGFGCPKCDAALFIKPDAPQGDWDAFMAKFFGLHRGCGDLEILEKRGSDLLVTGRLEKGNF